MRGQHSAGKGPAYRRLDQKKWDEGYALAFGHKETPMRTFNEFDEHTEEHWKGTPLSEQLTFEALAINGEAGELAEHVKKVYRDDDGIVSKGRRGLILSELGDMLFYMSRLAAVLGSNLGDVAARNKTKLDDRLQRNAIHGDGDNR